VGFYSLLASQLVGAGRVFAFEPVPNNRVYLERHLALNRTSNVEVLALALSDRNGSARFAIEQTGCRGHLNDNGGIVVPTATLDSLVDSGRIRPPNYIKMDIEGGELSAILGARAVFQRYHPVLFLATHGREVHAKCRDLLQSWGYSWQDQEGSIGDFGEVFAKFKGSSAFVG
jgi:FkbM family methyltransferase